LLLIPVIRLNCLITFFASPDPDGFLQWQDEYLSVSDAPGFCGIHDGLDHLRHQIIVDRYLQLDLGDKIDHILGAAVKLGMSFLPAETLDLAYRDTFDADFIKGI